MAENMTFRTLDKLHPVMRAFLETIYPHAPLRAVEFIDEHVMRAGYGRPMKPAADITVTVGLYAKLPMWVEDSMSPVNLSDNRFTVVDPDDWEECTPEYLNNGGCCSSPRVWCEEVKNHFHPKRGALTSVEVEG